MNILVIDEEFPYPLNTGKRIRTFNLTMALSKFNSITYLAYGKQDSVSYRAMKDKGIYPVAIRPPFRKKEGLFFYFKLLGNLFSKYPYIVSSHYTQRFQDKLNELVEQSSFDMIICEWTPYAMYLKDIKSVKKCIVAHNIESSIWKLYEKNEKNPLKKSYISIQRRKIEQFEGECFLWSDGATAVSEKEASQIKSFGPEYDIEVIDNGVNIDYFRPANDNVEENHLVFTGSMD
jgi:glycosyltransferase involved in cell wall biosynthesis